MEEDRYSYLMDTIATLKAELQGVISSAEQTFHTRYTREVITDERGNTSVIHGWCPPSCNSETHDNQ
jgi:hypothetical protein